MSIKLFLDTSDTSAVKSGFNQTPADSTFIFGELLPDQITNVACYLESASIPVTVHTFTSANNAMSFYENLGAVQKDAVIPFGTYSGTELASALQIAMNAVAVNTYTVSYSSVTKKMTISTILPATLQILSVSTCLDKLGFEPMSSFQSAVSSSYMVNLLGTRYVDLVVNFNANSIALNKRANILARILDEICQLLKPKSPNWKKAVSKRC